jgi:hypothetical protein
VPPTAGMTDIIVKIMIEVLSILAIATIEINQSRASELIFVDINRHTIDLWWFREICEEIVGENGY